MGCSLAHVLPCSAIGKWACCGREREGGRDRPVIRASRARKVFNSPPRVQSRARRFRYKVCTLHIFASHRGKFDINLGARALRCLYLGRPDSFHSLITLSRIRVSTLNGFLCALCSTPAGGPLSLPFFSPFFLVPGEICKGWVFGLARRQIYYERFESCVCVCVCVYVRRICDYVDL